MDFARLHPTPTLPVNGEGDHVPPENARNAPRMLSEVEPQQTSTEKLSTIAPSPRAGRVGVGPSPLNKTMRG